MAAVYPIPPPTSNTLDPVQRQRLLKSTQKLGALLGTTPRVLEPGMVLPPPLTPATRAFRREGKVFHNQSASSSTTSLSSESDSYVWISSPAEVFSSSSKKKHHHHKNASTPIAIEFPRNITDKAISIKIGGGGHKKSNSSQQQHSHTAPQKLSQPLLYRLRSVPIPPPSIISSPISPPTIEGEEKVLLPLSPLSPTTPMMVDNTTTISKSKGRKGQRLTESDRRRKMAKLTKTLGENIPPELVFGPPPPRSSSLVRKISSLNVGSTATTTSSTANTTTAITTTTTTATPSLTTASRRRRSGTTITSHHHRSAATTVVTRSKSEEEEEVIPIPGVEKRYVNKDKATTPTPPSSSKLGPTSPLVTVTTTMTPTTDTKATKSSSSSSSSSTTTINNKRRHRPRSLTLTHIPISGGYQSIIIEQDQVQSHDSSSSSSSTTTRGRSLDELERNTTATVGSNTVNVNLVDFGRRKEKEWSGEWNVRDMEEVMNALRCLRVR